MKKYEFTGETKIIDGVTLRRIRAAADFYALRPYAEYTDFDEFELELIEKGTLGGWIEKEDNLSQDALAWVAGDACVYGDAKVTEGALVYGKAKIYGKADIRNFARVFDEAKVHGDTCVCGHAMVYENAGTKTGSIIGNAKVHGHAQLRGDGFIHIYDNAEVYGHADLRSYRDECITIDKNAKVYDNAEIRGDENETKVSGDAVVCGKAKLSFGAHVGDCAKVYGSAAIRGAWIDDEAIVCGDTFASDTTSICGKAKVELVKDSAGDTCLLPDTYLTGDALVASQSDYLMMGPFTFYNSLPAKLVFSLTRSKKAAMAILVYSGFGYPARFGGKGTYLIDDLDALKQELESIQLHSVDDGPESFPPKLVGTILSMARLARDHFAGRTEESSASNQ